MGVRGICREKEREGCGLKIEKGIEKQYK